MKNDFSALEGTFNQNGVQGLLSLAQVKDEATLVRRRPQMPVTPYPYREEEVTFDNSEACVILAGTLTIPEGAGPFPAAVLISGSGPNDRDETIAGHKIFLVLADHLTRQGIAVLRFDKRGVGDSGGHFDQALTFDFASDVESAVRYLKTRTEADPRRIGLIGHSEGGVIAPLVAAKNHEIAFTVLLAGPGVNGAELAAEQSAASALLAGGNQQIADQVANVVREAATPVMQRTDGHPGDAQGELKQQLGSEYSEQYMKTALEKLDQPWMRGFLAIDPADALRRAGLSGTGTEWIEGQAGAGGAEPEGHPRGARRERQSTGGGGGDGRAESPIPDGGDRCASGVRTDRGDNGAGCAREDHELDSDGRAVESTSPNMPTRPQTRLIQSIAPAGWGSRLRRRPAETRINSGSPNVRPSSS